MGTDMSLRALRKGCPLSCGKICHQSISLGGDKRGTYDSSIDDSVMQDP